MKKQFHKPLRKGGRTSAAPSGSASPTATRFATALAAHQAGRTDEAEAGYRAVLDREPAHPHANNNLGILLRMAGRIAEAIQRYRSAVAAIPEDPGVRSNLAVLMSDRGQGREAAALLRTALALRPDYAEGFFNFSNVLRGLGRVAEGRAACARALTIRPDFAEAHANMGDFLRGAGDLSAAVASFQTALRLRPAMVEAFNNLGETLKEQGRVEEAIQTFQTALGHHPGHPLIHSNLLFALHYTPSRPPEAIHAAHVAWGERHARPLLPADRRFRNDRSPDRRLRIGYVSPDFCTHSCAFFSEPLLRAHDRSAVEVVCYPISRREDVTTARFKTLADRWVPLTGMGDAEAAAVIERDGIDILVDLAGHTGDSRLLVFARRPAPVQATWLGYPDTSGLPMMDFRITDGIADPMNVTDGWHTERLARLPSGFLAFQPALPAEPNPEPPSVAAGHVTFGSFNNLSKVTPDVVAVWAAILKRVPGSRLIVKSKPLGDGPTREAYARLFEAHGVERDRIDLLTRIDPASNHFRAYDRLDIALDPFPYNGTTTTCEALWMGVPVVTLLGTHHVARVGASLLAQCGLVDLIAGDPADYVRRAVDLAGDPARLADLRAGMTARLRASSLTDYAGFARKMEAAYRAMWRDWLARGAP
ncbi:O-linked N-acetylglucosamine transferase, SPINDLY family protein [Azospirillum agricola]|uniref:O-linked N-acetylglucosamine transferase, SPINDLY family protein n=1 Tax=Azospirillum agricola TaxID=1720247 RepID=UPI000A0F1EFE|nr:tetratricopeptide repeat protein [Azospirillum agricola]SMH41072.1 Predicted O-linked N-acetylglucosamine transferase, SPINDLY family [Azospirillum lipoferum]